MKTKLLFFGLTAASISLNAQWTGPIPSSVSGPIYRDGNTGIGNTTTDPQVKLDVIFDAYPSIDSQWGIRSNITQMTPGAGPILPYVGVQGQAITRSPGESEMYGIIGTGAEGQRNWGGRFTATGGTGTGINYGVQATAYEGNEMCYGIWAAAGCKTNINWAGYFVGDVFRSGTDNFTSDRKLKNNIQPLSASLTKIMKLKPSSYTYKRDEFSEMHLPKGKQMGLIAQDLEEVFPELVTDMPEMKMPDKDGKIVLISPEFKSVQYVPLIPVLIAGMQEQQQQIEAQKNLIDQLMAAKNNAATGVTTINSNETGFQMSQNEPNPFTHETIVNYTLPQSVNSAAMYVYDLTGKQITSFPINEKGASSMTITSEKLSAGIYIYSIVADGKVVDSKRMIVADK